MKLEIKLQLLMFLQAQNQLLTNHANDTDRTAFRTAMLELTERTVDNIAEIFYELSPNSRRPE